MQKYIFEPLDIKDISMFPTESMKARLAHMNYRNPDGTLSPNDHVNRRPLIISTDAEKEACLNSGGAGCFASPQDYCQILAVLLNHGTSPKTGAQILQRSTVEEMFRNQIPQLPSFARQFMPDSKKWLTDACSELAPAVDGEIQGWGLSFMLTGAATGRSLGSAYWAGICNCFWWCDQERGVAGLVTSQTLPFGDQKVLDLWVDIETAVYADLGISEKA